MTGGINNLKLNINILTHNERENHWVVLSFRFTHLINDDRGLFHFSGVHKAAELAVVELAVANFVELGKGHVDLIGGQVSA